jgi:hypothetical protein
MRDDDGPCDVTHVSFRPSFYQEIVTRYLSPAPDICLSHLTVLLLVGVSKWNAAPSVLLTMKYIEHILLPGNHDPIWGTSNLYLLVCII